MATYSNPRTAYGETLVELGKEDPRIVVLDADLCKSTMSVMFQDAFPERFFEMGIAEANMMSMAAGLAVSGKIAFASTFAVFATGRPYDQLRQRPCVDCCRLPWIKPPSRDAEIPPGPRRLP